MGGPIWLSGHRRASLAAQPGALWPVGGPLCPPNGLAAARGMSFSTRPTRFSVAVGGPQLPSQAPVEPVRMGYFGGHGHNHRGDMGGTSAPATSFPQLGDTLIPTPGTCSCPDPALLFPAPRGWGQTD